MKQIQHFLGILIFLAGTFSCGNQETKQEQNNGDQENTETKHSSYFKMPPLTFGNAKEALQKYAEANPENKVIIHTELGDIKIRLYEETPLHRANFIYLANMGFFNGTVFYRVIKDFMVQGGASDFPQRKAAKEKIGNYKIPAELKPAQFFHKKGALAMAKKPSDKPESGSGPYDFYIVQGAKLSAGQLQIITQQTNQTFSQAQTQAYTTTGGVPSLDGQHTVFGEVTEGLEVIDKLAAVKVRTQDNMPEKLISMTIEVVKE